MPNGNRIKPTGLRRLLKHKAGYSSSHSALRFMSRGLQNRILNRIGRSDDCLSRLAMLITPVAYIAYRVVRRLNNNDQEDQERW